MRGLAETSDDDYMIATTVMHALDSVIILCYSVEYYTSLTTFILV